MFKDNYYFSAVVQDNYYYINDVLNYTMKKKRKSEIVRNGPDINSRLMSIYQVILYLKDYTIPD